MRLYSHRYYVVFRLYSAPLIVSFRLDNVKKPPIECQRLFFIRIRPVLQSALGEGIGHDDGDPCDFIVICKVDKFNALR